MVANGSDDDKTKSFTALTAGVVVSHYKIISRIGAGGMGEVYLAEDTELNRKVALKFLPPHLCQDEDCRARFKREAQAAAALKHTNIITIYEVSEFNGRPFMVMEYVEGKSLREKIKEKSLTINDAIDLTMRICAGLDEAHEAGIVHRDLKPANILLDKNNQPIILDFGLATIKGTEKITKTGSTLGTIGYLSPEQARGEKADKRSDLFSVGVILYEMITGKQPFYHEYEAATMNAILYEDPEPIARFKSGTTAELQNVIDKALSKDVSIRYQTAAGMQADLKRLSTKGKPHRKSKTVWWSAAAIIIIVLIGYFILNNFQLDKKKGKEGWNNSVAVLIFRDQSPNKDQDYFCEGMTDAIISRLSNIKDLKVISLTSVLQIKDSDYDLKKIGNMLGVEHILEGSILKERDRIRVRAQLIAVDNDAHLWSDQFDQKIESIFDVQDNISKAIVDVMKIEFLGNEEATLAKRNTKNLEAFNEYTQGRYFWRKRTEQSIRKSIEHFERAIELDSTYALAYSGLADAYIVLPGYSSYLSYGDVEQKAKEAARAAVRLDDNLAEAHASMAMSYRYSEGDVEKAELEFKRAIELNPCYSWARIWYGNMLESWWQDREGKIRETELALECDPLSTVALNNLGLTYSEDGEYAKADTLLQRLIDIAPDNATFRKNYAEHLVNSERVEEAIEQFEKAIELEPNYWLNYYNFAKKLADKKHFDEADTILKEALSRHSNYAEIYEMYGWYHVEVLKKPREAIPYFEKGIEINPDYADAYAGLAKAYDEAREFDKAVEAAQIVVEKKPDDPANWRALAGYYYHAGKLDGSLNAYLHYLKHRPGDNQSVHDAAGIAIFVERYDIADSLLNMTADHVIPSERTWSRLLRSGIFIHQGKFNTALSVLAEGIRVDFEEVGEDWPLIHKYYRRGRLFLIMEQADSALAQFESAVQKIRNIDSTQSLYSDLLGRCAEAKAMAGREAGARKYLDDCWYTIDSTWRSRSGTYKYYSALVEYRLGNLDSALTITKTRSASSFAGVSGNGALYLVCGEADTAVALIEKAMSVYDEARLFYPDYVVMDYYYLARAYEEAGRIADAIRQYELLLNIWKNADEGLKPMEDAKERLTNLKKQI